MKSSLKKPPSPLHSMVLSTLLAAGCVTAQPATGYEAADDDVAVGPEIDVDEFRPALSPYGQWVEAPGYGMVWQPNPGIVGNDFVPYTAGHWVYTDAGWLWVSDYDWGWAPFHYGNWVYIDTGWAWVPGPIWGPAWVQWRYGEGYVGWAPIGPAGVVAVSPANYTFVQVDRFTALNIRSQIIVGPSARVIAARTEVLPSARIVNGRPVVSAGVGPRPEVIARAVGRPVTPVPLHSVASAAPPSSVRGVRYPPGASAQRPFVVRQPGSNAARAPVNEARPSPRPVEEQAHPRAAEPVLRPSGTERATPTEPARSNPPEHPQQAAPAQPSAPRAPKPKTVPHASAHPSASRGHR